MPSLFDMLADGDAKEKLKGIQKDKKSKPNPSSQAKKTSPQSSGSDTYHVHIPDFVALDLETTGLDRRNDRITEIGAVKYIDGKAVETFSTLVNPGKEISEMITGLTGITNEMVTEAPAFEDVADQVLEFIGRLAFCGHQVDFDFNFLNVELERSGRKKIRNWQIDTLSIARLVLDSDEGYALGKVATKLGIPLENAHRALDDAQASGDIALKLLPKLGELPPQTRAKLAEMAPFSFTRKILESSVRNWKGTEKAKELSPIGQPLKLQEQNFILTEEAVQDLFSEEGVLSTTLTGYQERKEQISYAQAVAKSLNSSSGCALEAGTGTGKTLGYLLPAATWAKARGQRVIITTATKNLQEQIATKELPMINDILGGGLQFSTLKGRNNYLCIKGWESLLSGEVGSLSVRERGALLPLIRWADETKSGDIEEQNSFNRNFHKQIWALISAENKRCGGCPHFEPCYLQRARKKAWASHIVVSNHALFFSDITAGNEFADAADAVIIDEAHQLEGWGHTMLRRELDNRRFDTFIEVVQQLFNTAQVIAKTSDDVQFTNAVIELKKVIKRFRKSSKDFLADLILWLQNHSADATDRSNNSVTITYQDAPFKTSGALAGLRIVFDDIVNSLSLLRQVGQDQLAKTLAGSELASAEEMAQQFRADILYLTEANNEGDIFWLEGPEDGRWIKAMGTTVNVSTFLRHFWKHFGKPVICTSATLSPSGDLSYFAQRIGLDVLQPTLKTFAPSFAPTQQLFTALTKGPEPSDPRYASYMAELLLDLRESTMKNILVLFTNNQFLKTVFETMQKKSDGPLPHVFAQGLSGNRAWIQQQMQSVQGAVLLGSGSFWEGVDIPGEGCEIVVIPKLPFPVPTHPLTKALAAQTEADGGNSFMNYFMPEALLKFRQGAGRLLRHHDDRGVLLVTDSRLTSKGYGKKFIRLVESELKPFETEDELQGAITEFFAGVTL